MPRSQEPTVPPSVSGFQANDCAPAEVSSTQESRARFERTSGLLMMTGSKPQHRVIHLHRIKQIFLVSVSLMVGMLIGRLQGATPAEAALLDPDPDAEMQETRAPGSYRFINPLLECDMQSPTLLAPIRRLEAELQGYIDEVLTNDRIEQVSVYYRDLANGPWTGVDFDAGFAPASLLKVPVLIAALKKAETDPGLLARKFTFDSSVTVDPTDPNFVDSQIEFGKSYTYRDLMERMIIFSDNNAKNMLLDIVGDDAFFKVWSDFGVDLPTADSPEDFLTVRQYSSFFRILYNGTYLNREMSEVALEILSRSSFDIGLQSGIPESVPLSSKFGERTIAGSRVNQLHDCGIVYASRSPYLICVMTRGQDWDGQREVIGGLSKLVYEFQRTPGG